MMQDTSSRVITEALTGSAPVAAESIESVELSLLLDALARVYGYDFRGYSNLGILRRVMEVLIDDDYASIADVLASVLRDPQFAESLVVRLTVPTTEFFRNPRFFRAFATDIAPQLRAWQFVRIWHAGCATGQEIYSMAIVLDELGLLERSRIYATDISRSALAVAKRGSYSVDEIEKANAAYREAGGQQELTDYVTITDGVATFIEDLRERIVFARHDLARDDRFNEFDMIVSRNVLLHFGQPLQERVLSLLSRSLRSGGFLGLGEPESVLGSEHGRYFTPLRAEDSSETGFYQYHGIPNVAEVSQ